MNSAVDFTMRNIAILLGLGSWLPLSLMLKLVKNKFKKYYWFTFVIIGIVYVFIFSVAVFSMFYVRYPDFTKEPLSEVKGTLRGLGLRYSLAISEEYKNFDEKDLYVKTVHEGKAKYIRIGDIVELSVCGISSDVSRYNELRRQNEEFSKKIIGLIERQENLLTASASTEQSNETDVNPNYSKGVNDKNLTEKNTSSYSSNVVDNTSSSHSGSVAYEESYSVQNNNDTNNEEIATTDTAVLSDTYSVEPLSIEITSLTISDSFHYEYLDDELPGVTVVFDQKKGIHGKFKYSRALSEYERSNIFHSASLYNANGEKVLEPENYLRGWVGGPDADCYAVQFPEGLPNGTYRYELSLWVGNQDLTATIEFVY